MKLGRGASSLATVVHTLLVPASDLLERGGVGSSLPLLHPSHCSCAFSAQPMRLWDAGLPSPATFLSCPDACSVHQFSLKHSSGHTSISSSQPADSLHATVPVLCRDASH